jgi:hypothetical protein
LVTVARARTLLVLGITLASIVARAHVAPSVDDNNRYLKLTPLGDRVRLAYTVFFGEIPGASERHTIDANRDGHIDDVEAHAFGDRLAAQVAAALELDVDGRPEPVRWTTVDVGMGTPDVAAGAFSVDMVAYACLASPRGHHRVVLRDRFRVPQPGETEAKVEDSPGVTIERAHVGPAEDASHDFRFAGPGGPIEDDGLELVFEAGEKAVVTADGLCVAATRASYTRWIVLVVGVGVSVSVSVFVIVLRRRRRRVP